MNKYTQLSFCGIYCGECRNFMKNQNCKGCREEKELLNDCPTRICAMENNLLYCGECKIFPCKLLNDFYHDGNTMHLQAFKNIEEMKDIGADNWLQKQKKRK